MKFNLRFVLTAAIAVSVTLTSCKKDKDTNDNNTDLGTQSDDQSRVSNGVDDIANDANGIISQVPALNGRPGTTASLLDLPCNADYTYDTVNTLKRLTINYHGNNCQNNRTRTGTVTLTMPLAQNWGEQGAVLTVETSGLHITRLSDNKSITISGTQTYTNVTGGRVVLLTTGSSPIIHDIASNGITVTFDNGSQRNWQVAKERTFSYDGGIVISTTGTHSEGGVTNISEWGTNRFGSAFTSAITQSMIIRQDCSWRITDGQITHRGGLGTVVATFGLDATGTPTSCPGINGTYYLKAVWTGNNGNSATAIYPY